MGNLDKQNQNKKRSRNGNHNNRSSSSKEEKAVKISKSDLKKRNDKAKYSDDEISRARHIDSKAKFIARDRIADAVINTSGKWIAVNDFTATERRDRKGNSSIDFDYVDVETFDKKLSPEYTQDMSEEEKHELTYQTAEKDIARQRKKGAKGPEYRYRTKLVEKNGKQEYEVKSVTRIDGIKKSLKKSRFEVSDDEVSEVVDIYCRSRDKDDMIRRMKEKGFDERFIEEQTRKYKKE